MFERSIITELEKLAARPNRKPLILRGSSQTCKTTFMNSFSQNFESYLNLNFEKNPNAMTLLKIDDILAEIFCFATGKSGTNDSVYRRNPKLKNDNHETSLFLRSENRNITLTFVYGKIL